MDWLFFILLMAFIGYGTWRSRRGAREEVQDKVRYYLQHIGLAAGVVALVFILYRRAFSTDYLSMVDAGRILGPTWLAPLASAFTVLFFLSLTPWFRFPSGDILREQSLMGYPVRRLPDRWSHWFLFMVYISTGVIMEEFVFRQYLMYSMHQVLGWEGDLLLVAGALVFGAAHVYQGWVGMLSNLVFGLVLGKIFLQTGDLRYPMVLHLIHNFTLVNLSARRLLALRRAARL
jgi:membrane protease YdiL (CAAX protease family)